jgi:hypothetical protein
MRSVTISATNVIAPMLAASEVIPFFAAGMATQASFGNFLGGFVFVGNDFGRITLCDVSFARTMTRFTTSHLALPTSHLCKFGV